VNFAKKLRDVVASNFVEIARADEDAAPRHDAAEEAKESRPARQPERTMGVAPAAPTASDDSEQPLIAVQPSVENAPRASWAEHDLTEFIAADGTVDFDRVLAGANLPRIGFTAEQVAKVLAALPSDLPMHVKRLTLKATLEAVDRNAVIDPQDVVADAMLKKMHVGQYRDALRTYVETLLQGNAAKIERLQDEISRLKAASEAAEQKHHAAESACDGQMSLMENVVVFFQSEAASVQPHASGETEENEDELPPFMRDDAVFRMLGLEPASEGNEVGESQETAPTASKPGRKSERFAVADKV
jgi:hypothetical protein